MMSKPRVGIYGARHALTILRRGIIGRCADITAVSDSRAELLRSVDAELKAYGAVGYPEYGTFIGSGLDAVIIADGHGKCSSLAIKALRHSLHVLCYPDIILTLDEAFLLERAVRESGKTFALGESFCYRRAVLTAREMYRNGDIGRLLAADSFFAGRGVGGGKASGRDADIPSTFMCTKTLGPMLYVTGARGLRVIGAETPRASFTQEKGFRRGSAGSELIEFDGGAIGRSFHGELACPAAFTLKLFGEQGSIEIVNDRLLHHDYSTGRRISSDLRKNVVRFPGARSYADDLESAEASMIACFIGKISGDVDSAAYSIDIWRSLDMTIPGILAFRSILDGGRAFILPDMRTDDGREFCRGDRFTTDQLAEAKYRLPPNKNRGGWR